VITKKQWISCGLFAPYYDAPWDWTRGDAEAFGRVQDYIDNLEKNCSEGRGLLICGPPGTGKTHMVHIVAAAAFEATPGALPREFMMGMTVQGWVDLFRRRMDQMTIINKTGDTEAAEEYQRIEKTIRSAMVRKQWLILDDIGKEYTTASGHAEHQIDRLIRARGNRGLPTLMTTNYSIGQVATELGASFASYVHQVCDVIGVDSLDARLGG
jgi:DNA replication protein DnaC